jgi:hypothetical protein
MSHALPSRPNLEHLRKQAKARLHELRARTPDAQLADAQHAVARDYGFASWPKLQAHVRTVSEEVVSAEVAPAPHGTPPPPGGPAGGAANGEDNRPRDYGFTRYTERARRATFFSRWEAAQFGSRTIEGEHLLLGLLQARQGIAACPVLTLPLTQVRAEVARRTPPGESLGTGVVVPFAEATKRALARAVEEADRRRHARIGTGHLLLGLLGEQASVAAGLLAARGIDYRTIADDEGALTGD